MCPLELMARHSTRALRKPAWVHVAPLSVERKMPPSAKLLPANTCPLELMARDRTRAAVKPRLIAPQLSPLLVERKTPRPLVPAKRCPLELVARDPMAVPIAVKPTLTALQLAPLS